jgi:DNA polymerase III alpha subunit
MQRNERNCESSFKESWDIISTINNQKKLENYDTIRKNYVKKLGDDGEEIMRYFEVVGQATFNKAHMVAYAMIDYLDAN